MRISHIIFGLLLLCGAAIAQSVPNGGVIVQGQIWTPAQWMKAWQSKQDLVTPMAFGAIGNGVADDTAAVQAWLNQGGQLNLGPHVYGINATGLTCTTAVNVVGSQSGDRMSYSTVSGF